MQNVISVSFDFGVKQLLLQFLNLNSFIYLLYMFVLRVQHCYRRVKGGYFATLQGQEFLTILLK